MEVKNLRSKKTTATKKPTVALLYGGFSTEREISLKSGEQVYKALVKRNYPTIKIDVDTNLVSKLKQFKPDVCFIALHGRYGEDGTIQGLLNILDIPYTGSSVLASALAMDKVMAKKVLSLEGISTAPFISLSNFDHRMVEEVIEDIKKKLKMPVVVKPANEGSTIGMSIVKKPEALQEAIGLASKHDKSILIENFIEGTEVTVAILGNKNPIALPTLEIETKTDFYDYETKYSAGLSRHIIPARISEEKQLMVKEMALAAHKALGCRGFSRVDIIVPKKENPVVLEVNTIPGMTKLSLFPDACKAAGIEFEDLIEKIIDLALEEKT